LGNAFPLVGVEVEQAFVVGVVHQGALQGLHRLHLGVGDPGKHEGLVGALELEHGIGVDALRGGPNLELGMDARGHEP